MEKYKRDGKVFLHPNDSTITQENILEIENIAQEYDFPIIIDMSEVEECDNKFFIMLRNLPVILLNTTSQLLSLLYITGFDKYTTVFEDIVSLEDNKRELLNRRLKLL